MTQEKVMGVPADLVRRLIVDVLNRRGLDPELASREATVKVLQQVKRFRQHVVFRNRLKFRDVER